MQSTTGAVHSERNEIPAELRGLINLLAEWLADEFLRENNLI